MPDPDRAARPATSAGRCIAPGYAPGEYHLPHDYARRPDSLARAWFTAAEMDRSLRYLAGSQHEDGGWPVRWAEWSATVHAESRPWVTLTALLTLRAAASR